MSENLTSTINLAVTARRLSNDHALWQPLVDFDPITRYYANLLSEPGHEAWLLTWLPGQGTDWHDHGASAGSFVMLRGHLREEVGGRDTFGRPVVSESEHDLGPGSQRTFAGRYVHRVTNVGFDPAVSLHVYAPKLVEMNTYTDSDGILVPTQNQRVGVDW